MYNADSAGLNIDYMRLLDTVDAGAPTAGRNVVVGGDVDALLRSRVDVVVAAAVERRWLLVAPGTWPWSGPW